MPRKPNPPPDNTARAARFIEAEKALKVDKAGKKFTRTQNVIFPEKGAKKKTKPKATLLQVFAEVALRRFPSIDQAA